MLDIYIARHGRDTDNEKGILNGHRDEPLAEVGEIQACTLANNIKKKRMKFDAIYSSPLRRARQTAQIISEKTDNPTPVTQDDLIERDFGSMTGVHQSKIREMCSPDIINTKTVTYFLSPFGAESFPSLIERARGVLLWIKGGHDHGAVLIVSHGDIGKMIYAAYYDLDWRQVLTDFHFGNSELLHLSPVSEAGESHFSFE